MSPCCSVLSLDGLHRWRGSVRTMITQTTALNRLDIRHDDEQSFFDA
jgi:hypothetical protein